jgi:hypothetical protein
LVQDLKEKWTILFGLDIAFIRDGTQNAHLRLSIFLSSFFLGMVLLSVKGAFFHKFFLEMVLIGVEGEDEDDAARGCVLAIMFDLVVTMSA